MAHFGGCGPEAEYYMEVMDGFLAGEKDEDPDGTFNKHEIFYPVIPQNMRIQKVVCTRVLFIRFYYSRRVARVLPLCQ